ncbi:MAG: HU family DNA-binding protein [Bacteroidaceae bacterium]|nr:HU family DNA-binding protein [Bacteroidaceae bacterium]
MNSKITLVELAEGLAARKGISKKEAETFVRNVFDIIEANLAVDKLVKIKGLGTFKLVSVESRESVNVNTGERFVIEGHARVTFTPDAVLRDQVNKPFADFETTILNEGVDTTMMESTDFSLEPLPEVETESEAVTLLEDTEEVVEEMPETIAEIPSDELEAETPAENLEECVAEAPVSVISTVLAPVEPSVVEEIKENIPESEPESVPESPAIAESVERKSGLRISWTAICACLLGILLLMFGCFYLGTKWNKHASAEADKPAVVAATPAKKMAAVPQQSVQSQEEAPTPKEPTVEELAAKYPQLPGGEYLIVGEKEEHTLARGEYLYQLARKIYGDKETAAYIILFNGIDNPDNVPVGTKLKLPELVKK